jgi:hypothetical protein
LLISVLAAAAQTSPARIRSPREFRQGSVSRIEDLPESRLRTRIERLPATARQRAIERLRGFHFTEDDLSALNADSEGALFYADEAPPLAAGQGSDSIQVESVGQTVVVSPLPAHLFFHSKPGASNVLYLNFAGENVTGTAWNKTLDRSVIPAVPFGTDGDYATFSAAEQTVIRSVWQRVAEDYAPFDVDVTTERPANFTSRTAMVLITRNTDANGEPNPSSSAGGIAYVNVFGTDSFENFRPAWVYCNNLGGIDSYIAESASHEFGHNLGLSHDGKIDGGAYYGGHGSGEISWGPIMGTGYNRNVTQWSKGDYYLANNTQDDLATIAGKLSYVGDDHSDSSTTATPLVLTDGTNIVSTTPENDLTGLHPANKGILARNSDVDVFSFVTGSGEIKLTVSSLTAAFGTRGGNLDVLIELRDGTGALIASNNPVNETDAQIQTVLTAGNYFLFVRNSDSGEPMSSTPSGYTAYGSIGQYFINGYIAPGTVTPSPVQLTATVNNPAWGSVTPNSAALAHGDSAKVLATPTPYHRFVGWRHGLNGAENPVTVVLNTNVTVEAVFEEITTTNHPTPYAWLAANGFTSEFENAVTRIGANGIPVWQSYVAGLDPNDPASQLRVTVHPGSAGSGDVVSWYTVPGRTYTLWRSTDLQGGFVLVPGATDLPSSTQSFTNAAAPSGSSLVLYRIEVRKP